MKMVEDYMPDTHKEKNLRACTTCHLIMSDAQWRQKNRQCPNYKLRAAHPITVSKTAHFTGLVSVFNPESSWVAKWNGLRDLKPGIYAVKILGEEDEEDEYERHRPKNNRRRKDSESDSDSFEEDDKYEKW